MLAERIGDGLGDGDAAGIPQTGAPGDAQDDIIMAAFALFKLARE